LRIAAAAVFATARMVSGSISSPYWSCSCDVGGVKLVL
jgi:hypothetical protein